MKIKCLLIQLLTKMFVFLSIMMTIVFTLFANGQTDNHLFDFHIETINDATFDTNVLLKEDNAYLYQACQNWHLSHQQIKQFFLLSERYTYSPYSMYYQIPCEITGTLMYQKRTWQFTINGGATGRWQYLDTTKYFGCHVDACNELVILPTDMMQ